MTKHCCQEMEQRLTLGCNLHDSEYDCPDVLVSYLSKFDEYGLIIHDGGSNSISITYCPWCGTRLPESKRDLWFYTLEKSGFDDLTEQDIVVQRRVHPVPIVIDFNEPEDLAPGAFP